MGYTALALGGLAARASQKALLLEVVLRVRQAVPAVWLHVLGLSSPEYAAAWQEFSVDSFDGSSHFKQAFTAGTFFTQAGAKLTKHQAARPGEEITAPECACKACRLLREDGVDTRSYGSNEHNMGRAAHNMNMLMRAQKVAMYGTTVLVSCVGEKLDHAAPARDLYQSAWFRKARQYAETHGARWYILSAKHGLLAPDEAIEPYNATLNDMSAAERAKWGEGVLAQIELQIQPGHLVVLAGENYRRPLVEELVRAGYYVDVPMQGLGIGQQLAWLDSQTVKQLDLFGEDE